VNPPPDLQLTVTEEIQLYGFSLVPVPGVPADNPVRFLVDAGDGEIISRVTPQDAVSIAHEARIRLLWEQYARTAEPYLKRFGEYNIDYMSPTPLEKVINGEPGMVSYRSFKFTQVGDAVMCGDIKVA
jgi:hypothetical protein